jgi:cation diffusion facilitator CzcD-associated flavoprotein CzcO
VRLADASPQPLWLDRPRPADAPPLEGAVETDLAIVGAGFTGLWAAVAAKQERPERDVVLLEAATAGFGGSGRNGGSSTRRSRTDCPTARRASPPSSTCSSSSAARTSRA